MFPHRRIRNMLQKDTPWTYPPLPPNHTLPSKKVSFLNHSKGTLNLENNHTSLDIINCGIGEDRVKKIISKFNEYDRESSDCESMCMNENEFNDKVDRSYISVEDSAVQTEENDGNRMRGGCGGSCCSCVNGVVDGNRNVSDRDIKKLVAVQDSIESVSNHETCPIDINRGSDHRVTRNLDDPSHSCPTVGSRPVCVKSSRCNSPCRSDVPGCGSSGCCSSGCRGGCGKPGRLCMPLRTCSGSTYQGHSFSRSHWSLSKSDIPRPVSQSRTQIACKCSDTSLKEPLTSARTVNVDEECKRINQTRPGYECLGGGLDCQRCGRKVYQAEMMIAAGSPYHNICFSCYCCRKPLEPLTYQENCGEIYCKQCLIRNFGPQGYGYGVGAGVLQTPT